MFKEKTRNVLTEIIVHTAIGVAWDHVGSTHTMHIAVTPKKKLLMLKENERQNKMYPFSEISGCIVFTLKIYLIGGTKDPIIMHYCRTAVWVLKLKNGNGGVNSEYPVNNVLL